MVSYAKKSIFPLGGIKCLILAPLTMGCNNCCLATENNIRETGKKGEKTNHIGNSTLNLLRKNTKTVYWKAN